MQISLICAVLLVAVSSVLAYDVDLWAERRAEGRSADTRARKIQALKSLVNQLEDMEREEQNKGFLELGKCVKLETVTGALTGLTNCLSLGKKSSRFDIVNRGLPLPLPIDVDATIDCLTGNGGPLNIINGLVSTVTNLLSCVLGTVKAAVPLKDLTNCVNDLVGNPDPFALATCVNNFITKLVPLNIPNLPGLIPL